MQLHNIQQLNLFLFRIQSMITLHSKIIQQAAYSFYSKNNMCPTTYQMSIKLRLDFMLCSEITNGISMDSTVISERRKQRSALLRQSFQLGRTSARRIKSYWGKKRMTYKVQNKQHAIRNDNRVTLSGIFSLEQSRIPFLFSRCIKTGLWLLFVYYTKKLLFYF